MKFMGTEKLIEWWSDLASVLYIEVEKITQNHRRI